MVMGDRIKTRRQLLDQQAGAVGSARTVGEDRHDESAHPHQTPDRTGEHVNQDGPEVQDGADAKRQGLAKLRERMRVIKQEVAVEVDRKWVSPWRTPDTFDLVVRTRLTGHQEYRSLQDRVRDATAGLPAKSDAATDPHTAR